MPHSMASAEAGAVRAVRFGLPSACRDLRRGTFAVCADAEIEKSVTNVKSEQCLVAAAGCCASVAADCGEFE
jgi:hypothetical protein